MKGKTGQSFPLSIDIGPYTYAVSVDAEKVMKAGDEVGSRLRGYTDLETLEIVLAPGLPPDLLRQVLWHEVRHAIVSVVGQSNRRLVEEDWISFTNASELDTLRRNPGLTGFLLDQD